jgi:2-phosphoglycerate kinase
VRAQLRAVVEPDAHPDLWGESFNLPARDGDLVREGVAIDAFLRQCAPIFRAVEAGVEYALTEGWDVIVEGVHLVPGALELASGDDLEVTFELLVVEDANEHVARFRARDAASDGRRPALHYEANLELVRAVQAELVERWHALDDEPKSARSEEIRPSP